MKKRLVSIIIILAMISSFSVFAAANDSYEFDRFEIRKGIYLGDSFEEVLEKNDLGFESDDYATYEENDDGDYFVWTKEGRIAGIEGGKVRFQFNNKTLNEVLYAFPTYDSKDDVDNEYSTLLQGLSRKYGSPLGNTNGSIDLITSNTFSYSLLMIYLYTEILDGVGDIRDYDEWKLEGKAYNVKIDLVSDYYGSSYDSTEFHNCIGYKMFTEDEYLNAIDEKIAERAEIDADL